jgi:hypothetical protein
MFECILDNYKTASEVHTKSFCPRKRCVLVMRLQGDEDLSMNLYENKFISKGIIVKL